jgi:hypothetical protein
MAKRSFANFSWTPTGVANAGTQTANGACFLQGSSATARFIVSEVYMGGLAGASAPCQMMLARDSTVAVTAITLGTNGSDAPLEIHTLSAAQTTGFSATTMPQRSATLQLLNLGFNAFGGIVRWVAYPTEEISVFGTAVNVGEISLSANTGGTPGLMMSHVIYEPA